MDAYKEANDKCFSWYAIWTRSRQEKAAAAGLALFDIQHFLPLRREVHQWSDRKQTIEVPLFSGYLFVCIDHAKGTRLQVLKAPGAVAFVGNQSGPLPIPHKQIEDIRIALSLRSECAAQPLVKAGDRVRVVRGPLAGVEGTLIRTNSCSRLLISIDIIHQSLSVSVSAEEIEFIPAPAFTPSSQRFPSAA